MIEKFLLWKNKLYIKTTLYSRICMIQMSRFMTIQRYRKCVPTSTEEEGIHAKPKFSVSQVKNICIGIKIRSCTFLSPNFFFRTLCKKQSKQRYFIFSAMTNLIFSVCKKYESSFPMISYNHYTFKSLHMCKSKVHIL